MKIKVLQENLLRAAQDVGRGISTKPPLPILSCILLETKQGKLSLKATDLSVGIQAEVGCKVEEEGIVAVSGRTLIELLSTFSAGSMEIESQEGKMVLRSQKTMSSIQTVDSKDFPPFPERDNDGVVLSSDQFISLIERGGVAAGVDETRPVFSSMLFECSISHIAVVATDGYRLSKEVVDVASAKECIALVPAKIMREVVRIAQKQGGEVSMVVSGQLGQVFFGLKEYEIIVRLVDAEFPQYSAIVPRETQLNIQAEASELLSAAKTAMVFSKEVSGIIQMKIEKSILIISSAAATGESSVEVETKKVRGVEGEISFNGKYLIEFLSLVKTGEIEFGMNESLKPGIFTIPSQKNFYYVVMPFRVQK
ncbi:MAG: DNA polymerase III subunit beta [Candidatus Pacebacteria bacterium]|nr:DNA polymerase III subunit beta [Candidatus Paceibacterota bacterium]